MGAVPRAALIWRQKKTEKDKKKTKKAGMRENREPFAPPQEV
jgi:hypothetical protein